MGEEFVGDHIDANGEFQSDKYPWSRPGFVPLKLSDPMAAPLLLEYASRRRRIDGGFADDLEACLREIHGSDLETDRRI